MDGFDEEKTYMPTVKSILKKRWDEVEEYLVDQNAVDNGDKSSVVRNYTYGDLKLTKGDKSYNVEIKRGGWVPKNQGLEEQGERSVDYYGFLVKNDTELWMYPASQITNLFKKMEKKNPKRFYEQLGPHSDMPGLSIHLRKELLKPIRKYT